MADTPENDDILHNLESARRKRFMVSKKAFAYALLYEPTRKNKSYYTSYRKWFESPHGLTKTHPKTKSLLMYRIQLLDHMAKEQSWSPANEPLKMMGPRARSELFMKIVDGYLLAASEAASPTAH